jgi:outer membrane protein assembly factor BamB
MRRRRVLIAVLLLSSPVLLTVFFFAMQQRTDRRILWSYPSVWPASDMKLLADGRVLLQTDDGLSLLERQGRTCWQVDLGERSNKFHNPLVLGPEESFFVGSTNGLQRFGFDGKELWRVPLEGGVPPRLSRCPAGVQAAYLNRVAVYTPAGQLHWERRLPADWNFLCPPVCAEDGRSYVFGTEVVKGTAGGSSFNDWLLVLAPDGATLHKRLLSARPTQSGVLHDGRLYVSTLNDGLHCLDAAGRPLWHFQPPHRSVQGGPLIDAAGGCLYFTSSRPAGHGLSVHCLDLAGQSRWRRDFTFGGNQTETLARRMPALAEGVLYVGTASHTLPTLGGGPLAVVRLLTRSSREPDYTGSLLALDAGSGSALWRFDAPYGLESEMLIAPDGALYVKGDRKLIALRPE